MQACASSVPSLLPVRRKSARRSGVIRARRLLALLILTLAVSLFAPRVVQMLGTNVQSGSLTYTVAKGETLWEIAATAYPLADTREVIAKIKGLNQLKDATIQPGQVLLLPPGGRV